MGLGNYQLRAVLGLLAVYPHILRSITRRREAKEGHRTEPRRLNERPDEKAIEVVVFTTAQPLGLAQFNKLGSTSGVTSDFNDIVGFQATQGVVQVRSQTLGWENEFATEELSSVSRKFNALSLARYSYLRKESDLVPQGLPGDTLVSGPAALLDLGVHSNRDQSFGDEEVNKHVAIEG